MKTSMAAFVLLLGVGLAAAEPVSIPVPGHKVVETPLEKAEKLVANDRFEDALGVLRPELDKGDADIEALLGFIYCLADEPIRDLDRAQVLLRKAALKGHAGAQYSLSILFMREAPAGNSDETLKWLLAAAENGHTHAQLDLGRFFLTRHAPGGELSPHYDPERALYWLERSLRRQGRFEGQPGAYQTIAKTAAQSPGPATVAGKMAFTILIKAARAGDPVAQDELLGLYDPEESGPYRDLKQAYLWSVLVARQPEVAASGLEVLSRLAPVMAAGERSRLEQEAAQIEAGYQRAAPTTQPVEP